MAYRIEAKDAALDYARCGLPVFPLRPGSKVPLVGSHGLHDASTDEATIREWWARGPDRNVSVRTGRDFGLFVLDIDARSDGVASIVRLQREHGRLPRTPIVATPNGGWHLWLRWPATSEDIRNSVGRVGPGLDVRANGGSIVAPPSVLGDGMLYRWVNGPPVLPDELAEPPEWLWRAALPPPLPEMPPVGTVRCATAYAKAVLNGELASLAKAAPGGRNHALNAHAFNIARKLVAAGHVGRDEAISMIESVAVSIGLSLREARLTIMSAFRAAIK